MKEPVIKLVDVVKDFGNQHILDHVNLEIFPGRTTVIAGGSGQGKSVTLKLILGLLKPDSGEILVKGHDVSAMGRRELNEIRSIFGVLFQGAALLEVRFKYFLCNCLSHIQNPLYISYSISR